MSNAFSLLASEEGGSGASSLNVERSYPNTIQAPTPGTVSRLTAANTVESLPMGLFGAINFKDSGLPTTTQADAALFRMIGRQQLSSTTMLLVYSDSKTLYAVVGTESNFNVNFGTPLIVATGGIGVVGTGGDIQSNDAMNSTLINLTGGRYLLTYVGSGNSLMMVVLTVSGTTITMGSAYTIVASMYPATLSVVAMTTGGSTFLVTYVGDSISFQPKAIAVTVSGTSITQGSPITLDTGFCQYGIYTTPTGNSNTCLAIMNLKSSSDNPSYYTVITASGNTLSMSTLTRVTTGSLNAMTCVRFFRISTNVFLAFHMSDYYQGVPQSRLLTLSGTTLTITQNNTNLTASGGTVHVFQLPTVASTLYFATLSVGGNYSPACMQIVSFTTSGTYINKSSYRYGTSDGILLAGGNSSQQVLKYAFAHDGANQICVAMQTGEGANSPFGNYPVRLAVFNWIPGTLTCTVDIGQPDNTVVPTDTIVPSSNPNWLNRGSSNYVNGGSSFIFPSLNFMYFSSDKYFLLHTATMGNPATNTIFKITSMMVRPQMFTGFTNKVDSVLGVAATATKTVLKGIATASGLIPGAVYYYDPWGILTTADKTGTTSNVLVGKALSPTELLMKDFII